MQRKTRSRAEARNVKKDYGERPRKALKKKAEGKERQRMIGNVGNGERQSSEKQTGIGIVIAGHKRGDGRGNQRN